MTATNEQPRIAELRSKLAEDVLAGQKPSAKQLEQLQNAETAADILAEAEALAHAREREAAELAAQKRQAALRVKLGERVAAYLSAMSAAETAARAMIAALTQARGEAANVQALCSQLGIRAPGCVTVASWLDRLGCRLSVLLRLMLGSRTASRVGELELGNERQHTIEENWSEADRAQMRSITTPQTGKELEA